MTSGATYRKTSVATERIGRLLRQVEIGPPLLVYRAAELEPEVSDASLISRQLAFKGEIVPSSIAVKRRAMSDNGVALPNDRFGRIGDDEINGISVKLPIDLKDRFEIAQLLRTRLRLEMLEGLDGLAIARVGQFLRREDIA